MIVLIKDDAVGKYVVQKNKEVLIFSLQNWLPRSLHESFLLADKAELHIIQPPNIQPNIFKRSGSCSSII